MCAVLSCVCGSLLPRLDCLIQIPPVLLCCGVLWRLLFWPRVLGHCILQVNAMDANGDGKISRAELAALLVNIGAAHELTDDDLQAIIDELGEHDGDGDSDADGTAHNKQIHIDCVQDLILNAGKQHRD